MLFQPSQPATRDLHTKTKTHSRSKKPITHRNTQSIVGEQKRIADNSWEEMNCESENRQKQASQSIFRVRSRV